MGIELFSLVLRVGVKANKCEGVVVFINLKSLVRQGTQVTVETNLSGIESRATRFEHLKVHLVTSIYQVSKYMDQNDVGTKKKSSS